MPSYLDVNSEGFFCLFLYIVTGINKAMKHGMRQPSGFSVCVYCNTVCFVIKDARHKV